METKKGRKKGGEDEKNGRGTSQVYLQQNKKKARAEGNSCHAETMWRQEKPIQLV